MTDDLLAALRAFADAHDDWIACDFELADGEHLAEDLLDDASLADSFGVFGLDGMGSLYAVWRPEDAIVYLASDWEDTGVLCESLRDFAALLTLGRERIGMLGDWHLPECERIGEYRDWAREELGIEPLEEAGARELVERARAAHPDLQGWIEERRA